MAESRSASQILFGFLPNQTVDLKGAIWKVTDWRNPIRENAVDISTLRRELRHLAAPWSIAQRDGGYVQDLMRNRDINVVRLDKANGVDLEPFPKTWLCKNCRRILTDVTQRCACGFEGRPRQLQFVGYCSECGNLRAPFIPRCAQHQQVRVTFPGTASASEIEFGCPICANVLRRGFGFARCDCGQGQLQFNVHRAASVYTARSVVIVNPPSPERLQQLMAAGGPPRALAWVLDGMKERTLSDIPLTREALRQQLMAQRVAPAIIEAMLNAADTAGGLHQEGDDVQLAPARLDEAQNQAVTIALACAESRLQISDLVSDSEPMSDIGVLYRDKYPACLASAGIEGVELCEKFPVLTGMFGYTRGPTAPGASRLVAFRERSGNYRVYADVAETEALFIRLAPMKVAAWLRAEGHNVQECNSDFATRVGILNTCMLPDSSGLAGDPAGAALLTLVHTYAHRFIRLLAVHAGIDRNALSELLVPAHLGFYVYAAARGDFVLGGLQAVFEGELDRLLYDFVHGERRCALDPGCRASGGACMACLHLGEPSCRYYNGFLNRNAITGPHGYLGGT